MKMILFLFFVSSMLRAGLLSDVMSTTDRPFFTPDFLALSDFKLTSSGALPEGVRGELLQGSMEWVRVRKNLSVPRARLRVEIQGMSSGAVDAGRLVTPFTIEKDKGVAEILVALIPGHRNVFRFSFSRNGKQETFDLRVLFQPERKENRVYLDPSCSRAALDTIPPTLVEGWVYLSCEVQPIPSEGRSTSQLTLDVFWAGASETLQFEGQNVQSIEPSLWQFNLASKPGKIKLVSGASQLNLQYFIPDTLNRGSLGLGLGPYLYTFKGGDKDIKTPSLIPTLYGSFLVSDRFRIVFFDIINFVGNTSTLFGFYWYFNYDKFLDSRVTVNLMLGLTTTAFTASGEWHVNPDFPQGVEILISDFFSKGKTLALGGFIRPMVNDSYSYNTWIRWGGKYFVELNFISWQWKKNDNEVYLSDSLGLTVGTRLFSFL